MKAVTVAVIAVFVAGSPPQGYPRVQGTTVTFLADGNRSDPPRIVADFNGWEGGTMTPNPDGRSYSLQVTLDAEARIEYLIAYRDRFVTDPRNPRTVPAPAGPPRSELRMPGYRAPLPLPSPSHRGTIETVPFVSRVGEFRRVRVYVPAVAKKTGLPILYVHDGDIFIGPLDLPSILDSLIDAARMAPVVVAFIDALDRHDDYEPGSRFRSVFTGEIVPKIEQRYGVARDRRALIGLSRSTVGALDACAHGSIRFETCALLAPAIPASRFAEVLPAPATTPRILIETGSYDIPLVADARALRRALEQRSVPVQYAESPQGHNHTAFRARLPVLMEAMFPTRSGSRQNANGPSGVASVLRSTTIDVTAGYATTR